MLPWRSSWVWRISRLTAVARTVQLLALSEPRGGRVATSRALDAAFLLRQELLIFAHKMCFLQSGNVVLAGESARPFYHSMRPRNPTEPISALYRER